MASKRSNARRCAVLGGAIALSVCGCGGNQGACGDRHGWVSIDAIENFDAAIKVRRDYAPAFNNRGVARDALLQYGAAVEDFGRAVKLDPRAAEIYRNRGFTLMKLGKYKEAISDFDQAIALKRDFAGAYYYRGIAKRWCGDWGGEVADVGRAIRYAVTGSWPQRSAYFVRDVNDNWG